MTQFETLKVFQPWKYWIINPKIKLNDKCFKTESSKNQKCHLFHKYHSQKIWDFYHVI